MPDDAQTVHIRTVSSISEIGAEVWDACAGTSNPFVSYAFLSAVEDSGSATAETGWLPHHLVVETPTSRVLGVVPLYVKGHSYGEYVFDHGWAHAYEGAGGRYYPKLQSAVPFTPVTGPRLLVAPDNKYADVAPVLAHGLERVTDHLGLSSLHMTFPTEDDWSALGQAGWLQRTGQQYHWENKGYGSFDDFLADLASRKRKAIKKERRQVAESGVEFHTLTGDAIQPEHWTAFYRFYRNTTDRKWGEAYLTREFFDLLHERLADRVVLIMASLNGEWVAGALNLVGDTAIFGRNWGCVEHVRFLHFEACYYRAIDFAIERGLATVEAGAQGQHKIQRGYMPTRTYSAHYIPDPNFRDAVERYLKQERRSVDWEIDALKEQASPFRKTDCGPGSE